MVLAEQSLQLWIVVLLLLESFDMFLKILLFVFLTIRSYLFIQTYCWLISNSSSKRYNLCVYIPHVIMYWMLFRRFFGSLPTTMWKFTITGLFIASFNIKCYTCLILFCIIYIFIEMIRYYFLDVFFHFFFHFYERKAKFIQFLTLFAIIRSNSLHQLYTCFTFLVFHSFFHTPYNFHIIQRLYYTIIFFLI